LVTFVAVRIIQQGQTVQLMELIVSIDHGHLARIDLNLLVCFDALLIDRNVTRAAERIGITQSVYRTRLSGQ
jgi:hypothetical protein